MPNHKHYNYNQSAMVVINYKDQLQPGTFEYAIHFLIENKLDLSFFDKNYTNDDGGRPAYDPAILLKIILFAYSKVLLPAARSSGAARQALFLRHCPATAFRTSLPSRTSSAATPIRLKKSLNRSCWSAMSKGCSVMSCLPLTAAKCPLMHQRNGQAH